jgi:predicted Zn-dependent protease
LNARGSSFLTLLVAATILASHILCAQTHEPPLSRDLLHAQNSPGDNDQVSPTKWKVKQLKIEGTRANWYSMDADIQLGKERALRIEQSMNMVVDPTVTEYVDRISQNLVRRSDAKVPFTIRVVDSDEIGVFALPGGFLYVTSGLLRAAESEAELVGAIAHGIAHVTARHATRMMTRLQIANIMNLPLVSTGTSDLCADCPGAAIGLPLTFLKFSHEFEMEADYLGLQYMYNAGYDPNGFVVFLETLERRENIKPGSLGAAFATHPPAAERIRAARKEIAKILPPRDRAITTTPEFGQIKTRLSGRGI